jgi:hypothetical protein
LGNSNLAKLDSDKFGKECCVVLFMQTHFQQIHQSSPYTLPPFRARLQSSTSV